MIKKIGILLLMIVSVLSCKNDKTTYMPSKNSSVKYALGFDIIKNENKTKLIIKNPFPEAKTAIEYVLSSKKSTHQNHIKTPLQSIVVTSTTHIPMLELLNLENSIVGFPKTDFVSSAKTRKLIDNQKITDIGHPENINTETLININPSALIGFSISSSNDVYATLKKMNIPVIYNGDWLEETPLGRAEWIKFFGVLFNKEKEADSIFSEIEKNYLETKELAKKSNNKPDILSGGLYKDVWYMPAGNSFEATFLNEANTNYLWKNTKGKGSLSLNLENVFEKAKDADIWLAPGFYESLNDLKNENAVASEIKAFKNQKVYSYSIKKGATGGIIYFELSPIRPDLVLKDLIKISHPELLPNYELTFFEKLQ
jgi:iron complex transport system substrate-binding protein